MIYDAKRAIDSEREYQKFKWPGADDGDNPHSVGEDILLAEELLAQARHQWTIEEDGPDQQSLNFVRKAAATLFRTMEHNGAPEREFPVEGVTLSYTDYLRWKETH